MNTTSKNWHHQSDDELHTRESSSKREMPSVQAEVEVVTIPPAQSASMSIYILDDDVCKHYHIILNVI